MDYGGLDFLLELKEQVPVHMRKPKKVLNLAERIAVIEEYQRTSNTRHLARMFGCGRTQIQNILRHKDEYLSEWANNGDPYSIRRKQSARLVAIGLIVYEWVQRCRCYMMVVTDDQIKQTGQKVARMFNMPEFRATNRWLARFKCKYKLNDLSFDTVHSLDITKKSLNLEDIIQDMKDPQIQKAVMTMDLNSTDFEILKHCENVKRNEASQAQHAQMVANEFIITEIPEELPQEEPDYVDILTDSYHSENSLMEDSGMSTCTKSDAKDESYAKELTSYKDALNHLGPLEQFALMQEDIRAIGLINQLENLFRDGMKKVEGENKKAPSPPLHF